VWICSTLRASCVISFSIFSSRNIIWPFWLNRGVSDPPVSSNVAFAVIFLRISFMGRGSVHFSRREAGAPISNWMPDWGVPPPFDLPNNSKWYCWRYSTEFTKSWFLTAIVISMVLNLFSQRKQRARFFSVWTPVLNSRQQGLKKRKQPSCILLGTLSFVSIKSRIGISLRKTYNSWLVNLLFMAFSRPCLQ